MKKPKIILASASPRRKALLELAGYDFDVVTSDAEEAFFESAEETAKHNAYQKAQEVFERTGNSRIVLGADTVVSIGDRILGKPSDEEDAKRMLGLLSGNIHCVITGVAIIHPQGESVFAAKTEVKFFDLTEEEILEYVATGEPMDKAGAYGVQEKGCVLVESLNGDVFNVIGLPVAQVDREIRKIASNL